METTFFIFTAIVLAVAFTALVANHPTQLPGQPGTAFPGHVSGPAESAGLSASPGLRQREFK